MLKKNHLLLALIVASLLCTAAQAADGPSRYNNTYSSDYGTWQGHEDETGKLVDELRRLVDKADKARAADPEFIKDLRELASRYDRPVFKTLFSDDFSDNNYTRNPTWQVDSGKFWIEQHFGLRSRAEQHSSATSQAEPAKIEEVLLGALLNELDKDNRDKTQASAQTRYQAAVIRQQQRISNAFVMRAELISRQRQGRVDLAVYQDSRSLNGYRLTYTPGSNQAFQLLRVSSRGESLIAAYRKPVNLEDNQIHTLEWQRDPDGKMTLKLNGTLLLTTTDAWFREDFNGFAFINNGGDYALRRISMSATY